MWDEPRLAHFLHRLSSFSRHIWFDPRGTGASDWIPHGEGRLLESLVDDMVAVIDQVGCERVALLGLRSADRSAVRGDASRADDGSLCSSMAVFVSGAPMTIRKASPTK